jgi:hypothetical protein
MTRDAPTRYFDGEGRAFMTACIDRSADWCISEGIETLVIFTGTGEGPQYAADELLTKDRYKHLHVVAVTPPFGRPYRSNPAEQASPIVAAGVNPAKRDALSSLGVIVISAHLPFKEINTGRNRESEWAKVAEAYSVLGGGFPHCIQAVLVACDAGAIQSGERVVVLSADTAFVVRACRTESFLSPVDGLLVEHIICRPARYTISKPLHESVMRDHVPRQLEQLTVQPMALPSATDVTPSKVRRKKGKKK